MPAGGLLDLVAHGIQDVYIIGNPQMTYFKSVYKRHTNFSIESIAIPLIGTPNFGAQFTCKIPVVGDLLNTLIVEVDLPALTAVTQYDSAVGSQSDYDDGQGQISWINNVGHAIIDYVELKIGGQTIDKQYGEWMEIWTQLTEEIGKKEGLDYMIARSANVGLDGPCPNIISDARTLIIPLRFWFCRNVGLSLPLISLQYHIVELDFKFRPLNQLYTFGQLDYYTAKTGADASAVSPSPAVSAAAANKIFLYKVNNTTEDATDYNGRILYGHNGETYYIHPTTAITGNGIVGDPYVVTLTQNRSSAYTGDTVYISPNGAISNVNLSLSNVRLYGDYIYLSDGERRDFAQGAHRYLIEQVQYRTSESLAANIDNQKIELKFNLPVKEVIWLIQSDNVYRNNDLFNYSHTVNPAIVRANSMLTGYLAYNGGPRFAARNGDYFRLTIPYKYHTRVPRDFYYMYSFALKPEDYQPSGFSNFSKIDHVHIIMTLQSGLANSQFRMYAINFNILRIINGMGSIAFGN